MRRHGGGVRTSALLPHAELFAALTLLWRNPGTG
jgi:hypothetical protein